MEETGLTLESVNKQINEFKKKIHLAEGQRKAHYEEWNEEKKQNTRQVEQLKNEIREIYAELAKETAVKPHDKEIENQNEITVLLVNKNDEEALEILDLKVIDLQKKLDLLRHEIKQELSTLENRTHLVDMNMMEAEHLGKKYRVIRGQLLDEKVSFESVLQKLEKNITQQEAEIIQLQKVYDEAQSSRDMMYESLTKQQEESEEGRKIREMQLEELRSRVEDHKCELERLERDIFGTRQISSENEGADLEQENMQEIMQTTELLNQIFDSLKEVTGVIQNEDVLQRFLSHKDTKVTLTKLKEASEEQKMLLEQSKEKLLAKLETHKFAEVKNNEQNEEEIRQIKSEIQKQTEELEQIIQETEKMEQRIKEIMSKLFMFCIKMRNTNSVQVPEKCPSVDKFDWLLCLIKTKIESAIHNKKENNLHPDTKNVLDKGKMLNVWSNLPASVETKTSDVDDEEEIPTRSSLKREAQLISETKNRRKGYRIHTTKQTAF